MLKIVVTQGEPGGIGAEVALKALSNMDSPGLSAFILGDAESLRDEALRLGLKISIHSSADSIRPKKGEIHVINRPIGKRVIPGKFSRKSAEKTVSWIKEAAKMCIHGTAHAMVTGPIDKLALTAVGMKHAGHTELLAELTGSADPMMLLSGKQLKVALLTTHLPLSEVPANICFKDTLNKLFVLAKSLEYDFNIKRPRIALAGLNPHAGDSGRFGREEIEVLSPAAERARESGILVDGPLPADTLFTPMAMDRFDAILACYHDQGLAPLKALEFHTAVNVTLNLPIVRCSPSHGVGYDIAGKGKADPRSMQRAIEIAAEIASARAARGDRS